MKIFTLLLLFFAVVISPLATAKSNEECTPIKGGGEVCSMPVADFKSKAKPTSQTQDVAKVTAKQNEKPVVKPVNAEVEATAPQEQTKKSEKKKSAQAQKKNRVAEAIKNAKLVNGCFAGTPQLAEFLKEGWGFKDPENAQWEAPGKVDKKGFQEKAFFSFGGSPIKMSPVYMGMDIPELDATVCLPMNAAEMTSPHLIASVKTPLGLKKIHITPKTDGRIVVADAAGSSSGLKGTFSRSTQKARDQYRRAYTQNRMQASK